MILRSNTSCKAYNTTETKQNQKPNRISINATSLGTLICIIRMHKTANSIIVPPSEVEERYCILKPQTNDVALQHCWLGYWRWSKLMFIRILTDVAWQNSGRRFTENECRMGFYASRRTSSQGYTFYLEVRL